MSRQFSGSLHKKQFCEFSRQHTRDNVQLLHGQNAYAREGVLEKEFVAEKRQIHAQVHTATFGQFDTVLQHW